MINSYTNKCEIQANNISTQQTNVTEVASVIETPIQNSEFWLLKTLDYYENQAKSLKESESMVFDQTKHHYPVNEVNRSEFRQVKWLVRELRLKLRNLLAERDEEVDKLELELKLASGRPFNLPKSCISQHSEVESIPETDDYLVTKLEHCSRQISPCCLENNDFQMRKRIAKCSTSSDFYCDSGTVNAGESIEEEAATNCNKNFNKYRRLSR